MNDRRRQQLVEQYEESLFMLLMDDYAREEGQQLLEEFHEARQNGTASGIPEELDLRCRHIINRTFTRLDRRQKFFRGMKKSLRVSVVILALLGVCTATVLSADALRVPALNFFLQQSEKWAEICTEDKQDVLKPHHSKDELLGDILPEGYTISYSQAAPDGFTSIGYTNDQGQAVYLDTIPSNVSLRLDNENVKRTEISLAGYQVVLTEKGTYLQVMWIDENVQRIYMLSSDGWEREPFLELALSLVTEE